MILACHSQAHALARCFTGAVCCWMLIWPGHVQLQGPLKNLWLFRERKDSLADSLVQSSPFDVERRGEPLPQDQILSRLVAALQRVSSGAPGELSMGSSASGQCLALVGSSSRQLVPSALPLSYLCCMTSLATNNVPYLPWPGCQGPCDAPFLHSYT